MLCDMCYYTDFIVFYIPILHCSTLPPGTNPFEVNNNNNNKWQLKFLETEPSGSKHVEDIVKIKALL